MDQPEYTSLAACLKDVPDPRDGRGQRYPWSVLLLTIMAALLSGQLSGRAMAQWATEHGAEVMQALVVTLRRMPCASTFRRVLQIIDPAVLEECMASYAQARDREDTVPGRVEGPCGEVLRGQALDGKEVRGAGAHGRKVHLLSLVRHESGTVLAQQEVESKTNEVTVAPLMLAQQDLRGTVTTGDALMTQRGLARQICAQGGDYLMVVKDNQPTLHQDIETFFSQFPFPPREDDRQSYTESNKGHGRLETRTVTCSALLVPYLDWPGVQQVVMRRCVRTHCRTGRRSEQLSYAVTSLCRQRAEAQHLARWWRGQWTIENRAHYVRDETLREDRCQIHTGHAPQVLAALKNGLLNALRDQGWTNIADALRYYGASVQRAFAFLHQNAT
jgi:predicted transposase YbfD/YdcC